MGILRRTLKFFAGSFLLAVVFVVAIGIYFSVTDQLSTPTSQVTSVTPTAPPVNYMDICSNVTVTYKFSTDYEEATFFIHNGCPDAITYTPSGAVFTGANIASGKKLDNVVYVPGSINIPANLTGVVYASTHRGNIYDVFTSAGLIDSTYAKKK